jgi:hypothetical protein
MAIIRTCVLTYDGKGFKFDSKDHITPLAEVKSKLKAKGYDYDDRNSVLFSTSFELTSKHDRPKTFRKNVITNK